MSTLEKIKRLKSDMPYQTPLKAVVVGIGDKIEYRNKRGSKQEFWPVDLADSTTAMRASAYGDIVQKFKSEKTYMITNYIVKKEYGETSLILTSRSKAFLTNDIEITEERKSEARALMTPKQTTSPINSVKLSPLKTKVTIQGKVTQVSSI